MNKIIYAMNIVYLCEANLIYCLICFYLIREVIVLTP